MKGILFLILLLLANTIVMAQDAAVQFDKQNVMYVGVYNPITVVVRNTPCKSMLIVVPGCNVTPGSGLCQFNVMPAKPGNTTIKIYTQSKQGDKLIAEQEVRVKRIPDPLASVGGAHCSIIRESVLKTQLGIVLHIDGFDFNGGFEVNSFKVAIVRNRNVIFEKDCLGARFDDETVRMLQTIKAGDLFSCTNIRFSGPGHNNSLLNQSIELKVID